MIIASLLVAGGLVWGATAALAVHDNGMFELDGNVVHNSASTPPYDWTSLFGATGNKLITPDPANGPVLADTFVNDTDAIDNTYFAGGVKIDDQVRNMACGGPAANDKTSMDFVYAAMVQVPNGAPDNAGHQVLYLAVEKQAAGNGGDNAFGFWLFKNKNVGCSGSGSFGGAHTDGDLFIDGTFTNGGGSSDVEVFRWNGNDTTGSLSAAPIFTGNVCGAAAGNDNVCGIANMATITAGPWRSLPTMAANTFVETGIDMTNLLGAGGGCFSTFLADSQSSQSTSSQPKDYAGGQLNTCVPPVIHTTATPGGSVNPSGVATQHDVATISAVGGRPTPTGTITFSLCKPSEVTAGGCVTGGTQVGIPVTIVAGSATSANASGALTTANGKYCWRADYTPDAAGTNFYVAGSHTDATGECFTVVHGTPSIGTQISVTGANAPGLGYTTLGDTATLTGTVTSTDLEQITFNLYGPYAAGVTPTCTGNPAFTTTGFLLNGSATTSTTFTPTQAGTYVWVASYGGDAFNDAVSGKCTDANESATVVASQIQVAKSANPVGPVSAGTAIGFDVTVTNPGSVAAANVHVTDNLPAGADGVANGDLSWSLAPAYTGCAITGNPGSQVLDCTFSKVDPGSLPAIHIGSSTTPHDCGTVKNKASATTTNGTGGDSNVATVTVQCPHLTIDKTADAPSVNVGTPIGFTITASNDGQGTASGVLVNDPLPSGPGITWSIQSATGPLTCGIAAGTLTCTGSLASGATETVHVTSPTSWTGGNTPVNSCLGGPKNDGVYPNTAQISATNELDSPSDDATTQVLCPDLQIAKTHDAASVNAGSDIGFTITASNTGAGSATGALINDPLPAGVTWSIDAANTSGPLNCGIAAGTLTCTGTLAAGATETVHITAPTTAADCGKYDNTATLTATNTPQAPHGDASTTVLCADVTLHKTADAASVNVGSPIGFTVTIHNGGAGDALGLDLEDPLPSGPGISWSIDAGGTTGPLSCSITNGTLKCTGDLLAGATETVHITSPTEWTANNNSCGTYDNTATATWNNGPAAPVSSNKASEDVLCPDLHIAKTHDAASVNAGTDIGFTITATNTGAGDATGALINDPLPGTVNWTIDAGNTSGPLTCGIASGTLTCTGTLAAGATETVHITAPTTFADCGKYDNTATLTATNTPQAPRGDASTTVLCADIALHKTADAPSVNVGSPIGFTVTIANNGTGDALGLDAEDPLPTGPGISWSIDAGGTTGPLSCSITNGTLKCTGDLLAGATETVHITSPTTWDANNNSCGTYDNTATATWNNGPAAPASSNKASEDVLCPDLHIAKTADAAAVNAGTDIGFTITATNTGAGDASGALINDPLPAGVTWSIDAANTSGPLTCSIASGTLTCTGTLAAGATETVHITAPTTRADCGTYDNTATLTATNTPQAPDGHDSTDVLCADVVVQKTADAASVSVGTDIGFTVTIANNGSGDALGVDVEDPLPTGPGISWSIDAGGTTGPLSCAINGAPPNQTLKCTGDLAASGKAGDTQTVHITSGTVWNSDHNSCGTYDNTATVTWTFGPKVPLSSNLATETVLCPDLSVTKTADDASVSAGSAIGFTVAVANSGPGTATSVALNDPLPAGANVDWSISPAYAGPGSCAINGQAGSQTLSCSLGDLAPKASFFVHITSATTYSDCGNYDNTATLHATNEPGIAPGSDSTKVLCPDVTLTKTADNKTVSAGDQIGFRIIASNSNAPGTGTATGVVLDDPLPSGDGVDWSLASGPNNCSIQGNAPSQTLHCTAVDLAPGDSETVHVVSGTNKTSCQEYPNTVTLEATNHARMTADATATVLCADIRIVKTPDAAQVNAGDQIGFTMVVFNPGAGDAKGATLKDTLPTNPGLHWTIASQGGGWAKPCTIAADVLTCGPDMVQAGTTQGNSTFTVHITSTTDKTTGGTCVENSGVVNNEGDVTTTNDGSDKSPASLCVAAPSVTITKTADHSAPVNAGDSIGFTVEVKNAGPGDATGVHLADALPAGSGSGVTWAIDPAVGTPAQFVLAGAKGAQTLSLASGKVPAGADYKVHVTAATSQTECSLYDNTATLTIANGKSPEPASASESCAYRVDLSITKAGSPATQVLGSGNITWTIVVTNNGPDRDTGVTIADPMPGGNTFVSAATSQGTCTGGAILNCNLGTMDAGATVTITLVTKPSAAGAQTNTVTVVGALPETNTANNQASATVQVTAPFVPPPVYCVAVTKVTPHQLFVGRKTMLTIHLTKHGTAAKGVRVLIKGPKLHITTKRSNGRGIVKQIVKMSKAGIDTFIPLANKHCNTKRIGVTGVFTPPVTG